MKQNPRSEKIRSCVGPPLGVDHWQLALSIAAGILLGLALLKFGNPIIFNSLIGSPSNFSDVVSQPWPIAWGYGFLIGIVAIGVKTVRGCGRGKLWIALLPLPWFVWQCISGISTIEPNLTRITLLHFGACLLWYYIGFLGLGRIERMAPFWICALLAFLVTLWLGFEQHYGGLEATRRLFYEQPNWRDYPPDYLKRIASDRIFSTLVYPNALAGAILLYLPVTLVAMWSYTWKLPRLFRSVATGLVGYLGVACLYWSGSKSGWLIAMLIVAVGAAKVSSVKKLRIGAVALILGIGLTGFAFRFVSYFEKGATSALARLEYWRAAVTSATNHPLLGSGPGTFSVVYARLKPPNAEMARLTHNDFLEQASDSGLFGLISFLAISLTALVSIGSSQMVWDGSFRFPVWMGLLGWWFQSFVEFPLYIPAIAWPAFAFMGWQLAACTLDESKKQAKTIPQ